MEKSFTVWSSFLLLAGCTSILASSEVGTGFDLTTADVGEVREVCGYSDRFRLYYKRNLDSEYIQVISDKPTPQKGQKICHTGLVEYLGCRTGDVICVDTFADYALRVIPSETE